LPEFVQLYVLTAIAQILAFALYISVPRSHGEADDASPAETSLKIFRTSIGLLTGNANLRRIVILALLTTPFTGALFTLFQPYFVASNVPGTWFGVALFISSLAATCSKIFAHKLEAWLGVGPSTLIATIIPGVLWIAMASVFNPVGAVLLFVLSDAAANVQDPIFADYFNRHIPSAVRATTLSLISLMTTGYLLVIQPFIGWIADRDLRWAFIFMGVIIIVGSVFARVNDGHMKSES
jgi:MFS family permease